MLAAVTLTVAFPVIVPPKTIVLIEDFEKRVALSVEIPVRLKLRSAFPPMFPLLC